MEFKLRTDYIALDNLLKVAHLAASGPEAKLLIRDRKVMVNGVVEDRVRRKLYRGDFVQAADAKVAIV